MAAIPHPLTYRFPDSLSVSPGQRVLVPLATRKAMGIVLRPTSRLAPGIEVREALRALDPEVVLSPELVKLGLWISDYYLAPPGQVFRAMLPLRQETRRARLVHLTDEGRGKMQELLASLLEESRGSQDVALLAYLDRRPGASIEILDKKFPGALQRALAAEMGDGRGSGKGAHSTEGLCRPVGRTLAGTSASAFSRRAKNYRGARTAGACRRSPPAPRSRPR